VTVLANDDNPLSLPVAEDWGVTPKVATRKINELFRALRVNLAFRYIPLNEISLELYEEVLNEALSRSIIVGVGLDYNLLANRRLSKPIPHLIRVLSTTSSDVNLFDDSLEHSSTEFRVPWVNLENAVRSVSDGYWLVGARHALSLSYTLPWLEPI
jgi:hypothetical protein